jgi:hypothetical protein
MIRRLGFRRDDGKQSVEFVAILSDIVAHQLRGLDPARRMTPVALMAEHGPLPKP